MVFPGRRGMGLLVVVTVATLAVTGQLAKFGPQFQQSLRQRRKIMIAVHPRLGHERGTLRRQHFPASPGASATSVPG
jgi:uncharacterized iron-regulated membrane protein